MPHNALRRSYIAAAKHVEIFYARLSASITRNPRAFILIPVSIVFLISYPAIYTLYTNPNLVSFLSKGDFKGIRVIDDNSGLQQYNYNASQLPLALTRSSSSKNVDINTDANIHVKQLWVQPSKTQWNSNNKKANLIQAASSSSLSLTQSSLGALDKQFLIEALQFQNELLQSLSLPTDGNNNNSTAFLYSIFQCWDNSLDKLNLDKTHLKTIQKCIRQQQHTSSLKHRQNQNPAIDVNVAGLFAGIGKVNGMVHSAEALKISLFYIENSKNHSTNNDFHSPGKLWDQNLENLKQSFARLVVFSKSPQLKSYKQFQLILLKLSRSDQLILIFANALVLIYFTLSLLNVHGVRSKLGLLLAFAVEMLLSILAAITLTFYWFHDLDLLQIPLQILSFIVIVVGIENMFRLLAAVSKLKDSIFIPLKFASVISQSNITSTTIVGLDLLILLLIVPFVSDSAQQFCVFAAIALVIDHALHLTYFTAVLSVDIRRLELEDLLERSRKSASEEDNNLAQSNNGTGYYTSLNSSNNSVMMKPNFASSYSSSWLSAAFAGSPSQAYKYSRTTSFRHVIGQYMLRAKLPFSSTVTSSILMLAVLVFVNINWVANGISFNVFELIGWGATGANNALFNATSSSSSSSSSSSNGTISLINTLAKNVTDLVDRSSSLINQTLQSIQHNIDADSGYPFVYFLKQKSLGALISQLFSSSSTWSNYIFSHGSPQQKQQQQQHIESLGGNPLRLRVIVEEPVFAVPKTAFTETELLDRKNFTLTEFISTNPATTYQLDFYYVLEFFVSFVFILTISTIILKLCLKNSSLGFATDYDTSDNGADNDHNDNKQGYLALLNHHLHSAIYGKDDSANTFQSKDLIRGHALDIVKISSNKSCPFIVSIGMDHRVLVWSPAAKPVPPPMSLPVARQIWPITHAVLSIHGNLIAVFSRRGYIKCWSRLNMSWIWSVEIAELKGTVPLEAFFRKKTVLGSVLRKRQQQRQQQQKQQEKEEQEELERQQQKSASANTPMRPGFSRQNSASSIRSTASSIKRGHQRHASISSNNAFEAPPPDSFVLENLDAEFELSLVLKNGKMYTISCADGSISETQITREEICTTKLLISSRVNDRLVCGTESGKIVVATVVNNKWRVRTLLIQEERYNRGKGLMTPLAMQRTTMKMLGGGGSATATAAAAASASSAIPTGALVAHHGHSKLQRQASIGSMTNVVVPPKVPPEEFESSTIVAVSFVGMIVRTHGLTAELIDVQTGTLVKRFHIGQFKKGTFHVFHDQPTHCRFCGCASISSFSIVYTELDTNMLIMHTFSNENRAKNSICLRVERDPRETRCLGFNSVVEHQHWLGDVEAWELTDLNMVQGVKRKTVANDGNSNSGALAPAPAPAAYDSYYEGGNNTGSGLRSRKTKFSSSSSPTSPTSPTSLTSSTGFSSDSFHRRYYLISNSKDHRAPLLAETWEGFTMSATGKVTYHEIPTTNSNTSSTTSSTITNNSSYNANNNNLGADGEGLLVKQISQITRFGHKAVVVPFGNVMKVLYLGNDGLISSNLDEHGNPNEKITGLSFVNKRRMRQSELMHSANFAELPNLRLRQS